MKKILTILFLILIICSTDSFARGRNKIFFGDKKGTAVTNRYQIQENLIAEQTQLLREISKSVAATNKLLADQKKAKSEQEMTNKILVQMLRQQVEFNKKLEKLLTP